MTTKDGIDLQSVVLQVYGRGCPQRKWMVIYVLHRDDIEG